MSNSGTVHNSIRNSNCSWIHAPILNYKNSKLHSKTRIQENKKQKASKPTSLSSNNTALDYVSSSEHTIISSKSSGKTFSHRFTMIISKCSKPIEPRATIRIALRTIVIVNSFCTLFSNRFFQKSKPSLTKFLNNLIAQTT